ncbi:AMP-binding protein [Aquipuribacter sp. SD81]|uniref:AMP-binding protein n=1 Tax=Aquipuribacter sp. SD81 TaxID=3127703 RepID=UPI0030171DFD
MPAAGGPGLTAGAGRLRPRPVLAVPVRAADGRPLLAPLRTALTGTGPAVAPHPAGSPPQPLLTADLTAAEDDPTDPTVAVVGTTGSTGAPRAVLLPASAVRASATATAERLGTSGTWLLAVPAHTVAGVMVCVRSLLAGTEPEVVDLDGGFRPAAFAAAGRRVLRRSAGAVLTSLVPTQLRRLLDATGEDGLAAREVLSRLDAVLVGGAALDGLTRERAVDAGVRVVETYGMTETCGGCVYDGRPLTGVDVALEPGPGDGGRVVVSGTVVARGYRQPTDPAGATADRGDGFAGGPRRFRTGDRGRWVDGRLHVLGRLDDVVVCGGTNVSLDAVARAARGVAGVTDAVAVGVPDEEWGTVVGLVVAAAEGHDRGAGLRAAVAETVRHEVGRAATPRRVLVAGALPLAGVGKPDRAAALGLLLDAPADETAPRAMGDHGSTVGTVPAGVATEGRQP